jgi:hypothetical protein
MNDDDDDPHLGPCCVCGRTDGVVNIMMLPWRSPTPGKGWGCVVCGLPADGASAVLCDDCVDKPPRFVCTGYVSEPGRTPVDEVSSEPFEHDLNLHKDEIWSQS